MKIRVCFVTMCLVLGATAVASAGDQQDEAAAKEAFGQGKEAFAAERFAEAADAFRRAYEIRPAWRLLYNIGQAEAAAKRYGLALEAFERYLVEGGDDIPADRQGDVRSEIDRLRGLVGFVKVIAPEGTTVSVDGVARGTAPLARELPVAAAVSHAIRAIRGEKVIAERKAQVSGGRTATVELKPSADKAAPTPSPSTSSTPSTDPAPEPTPEPADEGSGLKAGGWALVAVGGALLVAGGITGGLALKAKGEVEDECPDGCYSDDYDLIDKRDNLALTTDVLLGVGGAVAVAGVVMLIVDATSGEGDEAEVALAPAPGGLILQGRF